MRGPAVSEAIMEVKNLSKHYPLRKGLLIQRKVGWAKVIDDVTFDLRPGETFGLVGESGSGKTILARMLIGLVKPTAGGVYFKKENILQADKERTYQYRRNVQMIYQNPLLSLNPRRTVGESIELPIRNFKLFSDTASRKKRVLEILDVVGMEPYHANRYPHEFSGGQVQRIGIARALASDARVLILDEPVSALDVSIQAQILNLLGDLKEQFDLTYLFIANNLNVIEHVSDRVAVLCGGRIVEMAPAGLLFEKPLHPHTRILMAAIVSIDRRRGTGDVPELAGASQAVGHTPKLADYCAYAYRCPEVEEVCLSKEPKLETSEGEHFVACHRCTTSRVD
jgi:oligopeptide transport system ATP-binding protein